MRGRRKVKTIIIGSAQRANLRLRRYLNLVLRNESENSFAAISACCILRPRAGRQLDTYNLRLTQPLVDYNLWERHAALRQNEAAELP